MSAAAAPGELVFERQGAVQWITLNRPRVRNALTPAMYARLAQACRAANEDRSVRALVLTGAEETFAAGADIAQFQSMRSERDVLEYEALVAETLDALESVRVPTIAAIAGACTGAGAAIAAVCDLRLATPSARFGFPIARTLGNCLSISTLRRIVDLMGTARSTDLILRARLMDAGEMAAAGLVSEVTSGEDALRARAQELAEELTTFAPLTLWATKEALRRLRGRQVDPGEDRDLILACYLSRDFREGVEAFLQKRKPAWTGE
jgi:enoyl-CoA hydratase